MDQLPLKKIFLKYCYLTFLFYKPSAYIQEDVVLALKMRKKSIFLGGVLRGENARSSLPGTRLYLRRGEEWLRTLSGTRLFLRRGEGEGKES